MIKRKFLHQKEETRDLKSSEVSLRMRPEIEEILCLTCLKVFRIKTFRMDFVPSIHGEDPVFVYHMDPATSDNPFKCEECEKRALKGL